VLNEVFDLFCELEASDDQTNFPTLYAVGKQGMAKHNLEDEGKDLTPLFDTIIERVKAPLMDDGPLQLLVHNIEHDEYVGRLAIGRIKRGSVKVGQTVALLGESAAVNVRLSAVYSFEGNKRIKIESADCCDIVAWRGWRTSRLATP
jgi:GTP-binding protein